MVFSISLRGKFHRAALLSHLGQFGLQLTMQPFSSPQQLHCRLTPLKIASTTPIYTLCNGHSFSSPFPSTLRICYCYGDKYLATQQAKLTQVQCSVTNIEKQRLYFTADGVSPYMHRRRDVSGRYAVQQSQVVMGLLYSFSIHWNMSSDDEVGLHFTVTRDRNKEYHIYRRIPVVPPGRRRAPKLGRRSGWDSSDQSCSGTSGPSPLLQCQQRMAANTSSAQSVRVASYNVWNVNSLPPATGEDYRTRLNRLIEFIASLNVDVFGFQEVRLEVADAKPTKSHKSSRRRKATTHTTQSQVSDLARGLPGYHFVYQPAMLYMENFLERKEEGLAVFSRYPILSSNYRLLFKNDSDPDDTHQRICLHAELSIPQLGPVHVFVSHLSLSQVARERAVLEIWEFMQQYSGVMVLMGDMNAEPDSTAIRFLTGEASIGGVRTSGLQDSWTSASAKSSQAGLTFNVLEEELVKRIDYIFVNFQSSTHPVNVASSEVIRDETICTRPCSDHHLVLTILSPSNY